MDLTLKRKCRKVKKIQTKYVNMQSLKMLTLNGTPYMWRHASDFLNKYILEENRVQRVGPTCHY